MSLYIYKKNKNPNLMKSFIITKTYYILLLFNVFSMSRVFLFCSPL